MKYIFCLVFMISCSQTKLLVDGKTSGAKITRHGKYKEVTGAGDTLRNVSAATLIIKFRQTGKQETPQDLISFSTGGKKSNASRASIRMDRDGYLTGIARASDTEEAQNIRAKESISSGDIHHAALVIDYAKNEMRLYLDGRPIETEGNVLFKERMTSDTPSAAVSIGSEDDGSDFFFEGELHDPMIFRKKLEPSEILGLTERI